MVQNIPRRPDRSLTSTSSSQSSSPDYISGPYDGEFRLGIVDHQYWRCEACGLESTNDLSDGCPECGGDGD